ncbi:SLC13 family permease [Rubrivirga marina]|uniref:SLC13 family permease n=1 Tax=Rubrivirga marina TaxID=1196024 RepID=A0A271J0Y0_9BACT|nr:SLC13 family permease [Rubrivirga marina]PAP77113.1 SLC13 family permease [Rubrivirga marina]
MAGLSWEAWLTLAVVAALLVALVRGVARPDLLLLASLAPLLVAGVLTPEDAFAGFANPAVIAVGALFVVAAGVQATGALAFADRLLFRNGEGVGRATARLMLTTATLSAFLNNTPLVAMLMPRVQAWCARAGVAPSKLMIPLSYAAIVGGTTTLIGTSTNLVVAGLVVEAGGPEMGLFDLTPIALPAALALVAWFGLVGHRLLPDRGLDAVEAGPVPAECLFEVRVAEGSPLVGRSVEEAGLRDLDGAYLAHIEPRDSEATPATPATVLRAGDRLLFVGALDALDGLLGRPGLGRPVRGLGDGLPLFEAVVAVGSELVGRTLREVAFRERYGGVVVGVRRRDRALTGGLGRAALEAGDLLLVEAPTGFAQRWGRDRDTFVVVARVRPGRAPAPPARRATSLAILAGVIGVSAVFDVPIATTAFVGALAMVASGCLSGAEARRSVDLPVLLVIASAFGLGRAIEQTGLAEAVAVAVGGAAGPFGAMGVVVAAFVATSLLTELITNNAAAALMVGVGLESARAVGAPPEAFALAIAVAASCSFLTPIGYQTNMMVMSAGRYRVSDFLVSGAAANLIVGAVSLLMIWVVWF